LAKFLRDIVLKAFGKLSFTSEDDLQNFLIGMVAVACLSVPLEAES
jgi:hypothetical protein